MQRELQRNEGQVNMSLKLTSDTVGMMDDDESNTDSVFPSKDDQDTFFDQELHQKAKGSFLM